MLKKIALTVAAFAALAGISFGAAGSTTPQLISDIDGINFKTSQNVKVAYKNEGGTVPQKYAIVAKHTSGDTYYATSNLSTAIYKLQASSYMGQPLDLGGAMVTGVNAGETVFTNAAAGYTPM